MSPVLALREPTADRCKAQFLRMAQVLRKNFLRRYTLANGLKSPSSVCVRLNTFG